MSRLEEIENRWYVPISDRLIADIDITWLISRVRDLEEELEKVILDYGDLKEMYDERKGESKRYKQALEELESLGLQKINTGNQIDPNKIVDLIREFL